MDADTREILTVCLVMLGVLLIPLVAYGVLLLCNWLAQHNIFFTIVPEGRARIIEVNGKFHRAIMTYTDHAFRGNTELTQEELDLYPRINNSGVMETDEERKARVENIIKPHPWDVVKRKERYGWFHALLNKFGFGGIRILGLPKIYKLKTYRQRWVSKEAEKQTAGEIRYKFETKEREDLDYVLLQEDTYYIQINQAETAQGFPLRVILAVTVGVVNPWRAIYGPQHWLEAVTNQTEPEVRQHIRGQDFFDALDTKGHELLADISLIDRFRNTYGADMRLLQIFSIDPDGPDAEKYRGLTTLKEQSMKEAERVRIQSDAENYRLKQTAGYLNSLDPDTRKWTAIADSNLTTYVEGGSNGKAVVPVGGSQSPQGPAPQPSSKGGSSSGSGP